MTLFVDERGEGAVPIVMLHGFGGSHAVWKAVVGALPGTVRTLAYDLPGHASSAEFPHAGPAKVAAKAVLADLARRGLDGVHLVGHSMGGAIALLMAMFEPDRFSGLTLLAPGGLGPEINARLLRRYAAAADVEAMRVCLEGMYGFMSPVDDATVSEDLAPRLVAGRIDKLKAIAELITSGDRQGVIPSSAIAAIPVPIDLVWGELDTVLPFRHCRGLPPHIAVHAMPDIGHMLPHEASDLVARLVAQRVGIGG